MVSLSLCEAGSPGPARMQIFRQQTAEVQVDKRGQGAEVRREIQSAVLRHQLRVLITNTDSVFLTMLLCWKSLV